jgi:Na+/melibiose symporter-like transporter
MSGKYSRLDDGNPRDKTLPALTVFCYGVGHFLNDMTGACWFNYLLYYLITVCIFPII